MRTPPGDGADHRATVVPLDERRARGRRGARRRPAEPVGTGSGITMAMHAGVPVVSCEGHLGSEEVRAASQVFAAAVRLRPRSIVVDLGRATVDEASVPVLGLMRHFAARHGVALVLAAVPPRGLDVLRRVEVAGLYEVHATLALAVGAAVARSHRSLPRRDAGS